MQLTSTAFKDGQEIPQKYGKKFDNTSLPLAWGGAPAGTKSFALSIIDRHPIARNYIHWFVADVAADVAELKEGAAAHGLPTGAKEVKPYAGPFPPSGTHAYEITVYALKTDKLDLPPKATREAIIEAVQQNAIATGVLTGLFTKQKS